jgi:glycosyltransferase involved in cell wall biosynthesis
VIGAKEEREMLKGKTVAVVIPAFNEELLIGKVLQAIPNFVDKVIVIDDGSTDRTVDVAKSHNAMVISQGTNRGVGMSLQTGINKVLEIGSEIMVNIDADNQFDAADIETIVMPIAEDRTDFVTASRFKDKQLYPVMSKVKFWGNKVVSFIVSTIIGTKFHDVSCGFRAYSKDTLFRLNLHGKFTYTHETILLLSFQNVRLMEVPVKIRGTREIGESRIASNVIRYGFKTLRIILQTYRDYDPFRMFTFIGALFLVIALISGSYVSFHFLSTGYFSPYKWVGFLSGGSLLIFMGFALIGFVIESLSVIRKNQDEILYYLKKLNLPDKKNETI